ncbi:MULTISPECIES: D-alanyl-D-alanine carboxypeptidase [Streptomyces]|uniref:serine-type D-Ala-D-Ala carboxypeptidase n=1 Tax=Streptomyces mirabilis TaxID=68239 RepID=A0ABU3USZ2_9ACTN|nr:MULTISPECIES: D-alanyl-D-alanine carboxypeptidase [Streptomyces]MDU8996624.1 D-alanyl-D-alanine carboxypeptidase [Streptomyces mirabilis]QDN88400.1 D-alanyl-D-alanine carboxypeptidase [Streptomyces sp. RLB3-6]QDO09251.1 D-alanyl-D-alanine carboxypeptidase [Streptomyces sp. S1D4-23]
MAGESPDRSKQHEASASSAEATPGTPAAVAGPNRAAAAAAADPRLAVARERAATVRVDQATAVFSTRALAEGSAGSGGKGPGPGEDARLREAVAAWVAGADEEAPEGESEVPEASKGPEGPDKASKGAEKAGTAAEAGTGAEAETEAGAEVEAEVEAAAGVAGEVDGESASGSDADAGADSDAAADDDSDSDSDSGSTSDADSDAKSASEGEVEAEGTVADDADTDADAEPKTDAKSTSDAESETAPESESETEAETKSETEDAKPAEAKSSPEDASETSEPSEETAEKTSETSETSADSEGLEDFASPEASSDVEDAKDAKDSEDSAAQKDSKDTPPADGSASADDSPSAKDAPDTDDAPEPPVDQPTAIFKAPKRPAVDQPTTMLKLGGAKPATDKPADQPKAEQPKVEQSKADQSKADRPKPESPSERTSKFVALKPLDEPVSRVKPKTTATPPVPSASSSSSPTKAAPADATAALPQVGPERTTQQPLPPKPPLDLLAELTNTPPPPQTPVRTLARRVKIWTPLVLLLAVIFAVAQSLRPLPTPTLDLTAESSYTFGGGDASIPWPSSGQGALDVQGIGSFGTSGAQKAAPIASVAKVMTAYLILRDHPIKSGDGAKIKVDQKAQDQSDAGDESTVNVHAGDTITQKEALEGVLIASANNVARLLARWDAGSETAFVAKMNAAAKDLGMTNTTYTDPSGLTKTTVSTAADQVKLAKAAMKDASFREVARMMEYTDYKGTRHSNWNHLVGSNNVIGIKTGTTTAAGGNLVFAATKEIGGEVRTIVGAVISQGPGGSDNTILGGALAAGDKLIRAAQASLKSATILKKGDVVGYVDDGLGGRTPVVITKDVTAVGWAGLKVKLSFVSSELPHSAKAGTKVGSLTVGDGGSSSAVQVPVELQKDLAEPGFGAKLTRVS